VSDSRASGRWLVVGHGSVGSFLTARLRAAGAAVFVFDPAPRVPIVDAQAVTNIRSLGGVDYVVSCVPPDVAASVPALVGEALERDGIFFDWNTVAPAVKRSIETAVSAATVDVALLDSLDGNVERPNLAVSGPAAEEAARILDGYRFDVVVAGPDVGEAASLKYLRSIFMKGLEALVLEYASLASDFPGEPLVRASLESNLGERFVDFMDLLLTTNRIHAERRSRELVDALGTFGANGVRPAVAGASAEVLQRAARAWSEPNAPPADAPVGDFARYLRTVLWPQAPST